MRNVKKMTRENKSTLPQFLKVFIQDSVVLGHYKAVIKHLINSPIAINSVELNLFVCWIDSSVTKSHSGLRLALGTFPFSETCNPPILDILESLSWNTLKDEWKNLIMFHRELWYHQRVRTIDYNNTSSHRIK